MAAGRRLFRLVCLAGILGLTTAALAGAAVSWGKLIEVPGTAALNAGGSAEVMAISCATARNCGAGGRYTDASHHAQAFVAAEQSGVWHNATEVPGTAALNVGGSAAVTSISCPTAGNCAAGGYYYDGSSRYQVFVVSEQSGVWHNAIEVPGTAALNAGGDARVTSISCPSAGNCVAGGSYYDGSSHYQTFVVSEQGGVWHNAIEVPGTAALNVGSAGTAEARTTSVSCSRAGNCAAGGWYTDGSGNSQAFVASEKGGVWSKAIKVPGTAALNLGNAALSSVSCTKTIGYCAAVGVYTDGSGRWQTFVVDQKKGIWGKAKSLPGYAALNTGPGLGFGRPYISISCAKPGYCAAGGSYNVLSSSHLDPHAFVVDEKMGVWGKARPELGNNSAVVSISCASAGNCAAAIRTYDPISVFGPPGAPFVVRESSGVWQIPVVLTGQVALSPMDQYELESISCKGTSCATGGFYIDGSHLGQAFVTAP